MIKKKAEELDRGVFLSVLPVWTSKSVQFRLSQLLGSEGRHYKRLTTELSLPLLLLTPSGCWGVM